MAGVNNKAQLAELERIFQANQARALLDAGVTLADPARIDIRGELRCGRDVSIDVNCVFEGDVTLGDGVSIGPNCVLKTSAWPLACRWRRFRIWMARKLAPTPASARLPACAPARGWLRRAHRQFCRNQEQRAVGRGQRSII